MTLEPRAAALAFVAASAPAAAFGCALPGEAETVAVERVVDGDTLLLDDGRTIRLAGVAAPKPPLGVRAEDWPLAEAARAGLAEIASGQVLEFRTARQAADRHGRLLGFLTAIEDRDHAGLAAALLKRGLARHAADGTMRDCRATLVSAEDAAIRARLGLWSQPYYAVKDAGEGAVFAESSGRFVVAEGRVASVRTSAGRAYVNFGERWREALSLVLSEATLKRLGGFEALGVRVGARLRVRGTVEARQGPTILVTEAAQIDRLGGRER